MIRSGSAGIIDNSLDKLMSAESNEFPKVVQGQKATKPALSIDFSNESLLNAIVMAEVLGKPKCRKRNRW